MRQYRFPPLDSVKTITGKVLDKHRNLPTEEMYDAISEYVDKMDCSNFARDDDGWALASNRGFSRVSKLTDYPRNPTEYAPPEDTFSPVLHRIDQVVRWRAIHPDEPIPPVYDILTQYSHPNPELVEQAKEPLDRLITASNVKKGGLSKRAYTMSTEIDAYTKHSATQG